jgi:hypothetical protein
MLPTASTVENYNWIPQARDANLVEGNPATVSTALHVLHGH